MALILKGEIEKRLGSTEFLFAVSALDFDEEKRWADYYKIQVIPRDNWLSSVIRKHKFLEWMRSWYIYRKYSKEAASRYLKLPWQKIGETFKTELKNADIVIDMSGVAYVGDNMASLTEGFDHFSIFHCAKKYRKPYMRFVQSFGPFQRFDVKFFAKKELGSLPFIFSRGKRSAEHCRKLLFQKKKIYDFPDIAILLPPASAVWLESYLKRKNIFYKNYIVLSPNAIMSHTSQRARNGMGIGYFEFLCGVISKLLDEGEQIVLLPHMYSSIPEESDRSICLDLVEQLGKMNQKASSMVHVILDDLDPHQAKAVISASKLAIVSRYHAFVAALSSMVPAIAVGWNDKYQDIAEYYGLSHAVIDAREEAPESLLQKIFALVDFYKLHSQEVDATMKANHHSNILRVKRAFDLLCAWIKKTYGGTN